MTTHVPAFLQIGEHFGNLLFAHTTLEVVEHGSHPLAATCASEVTHPEKVTHTSTNPYCVLSVKPISTYT